MKHAQTKPHVPLQLYANGVSSSLFTLVLQGRVIVKAGTEGFQSALGPWSCLGTFPSSAAGLIITSAGLSAAGWLLVPAGALELLLHRVGIRVNDVRWQLQRS